MDYVRKEIKNNIAYITIDRPPVNALVRQAYVEIGDAFKTIYDELDQVRAVIFTGAGKQFIAGNDLNEFEEQTLSDMNEQGSYFAKCLTYIYNCPVPVIAAVNGAATGAGFCIAAVADVIIAAEGARFGLPEMKVGVLGGLTFLPAMVPEKVGRYMTLTGELLPAEKLEQYGSVHKVVPKDRLIAEAEEVAEKIKLCPPLGVRAWKRAYKTLNRIDITNIEHFTDMFIFDLMDTEDAAEAARAFLEKRKPEYKCR